MGRIPATAPIAGVQSVTENIVLREVIQISDMGMELPRHQSNKMIYLIHFDKPLAHARHYMGYCEDGTLEERLNRHRAGNGSRMMQVIKELGIPWTLARVWTTGDRNFERKLKKQNHGPRLCPICKKEKS